MPVSLIKVCVITASTVHSPMLVAIGYPRPVTMCTEHAALYLLASVEATRSSAPVT